MEKINLNIPKKSEYMSTIRLTTTAILNANGYNIDDIEDLKVVISEVCTYFINKIKKDEKPFQIDYIISEKKITVEVTDLNEVVIEEQEKDDCDMCIMIINSLADSCTINLKNNKISFEKNLIA